MLNIEIHISEAQYWMGVRIIIILFCGELWRMSGSHRYNIGKWARCIVLPFILAWYFAWQEKTLVGGLVLLLILVGLWQLTRMGYGIPGNGDKGSSLGRIFRIAELVRGVAGAIYSLPSLMVLPKTYIGVFAYFYVNFAIGYVGSLIKLKAKFFERLIGMGVASIILWR